MKLACLCLLALATGCFTSSGGVPDTRPKLPDGGFACSYVAPQAHACCNGGSGCGGALWCNTASCACEDVENPCSTAVGGSLPDGGTPDPGPIPSGAVGLGGGTVERLWFATTGDTRPGNCDATADYPRETVKRIAASMKALNVQFALDLGDHMFVCNRSVPEAQTQMGYYMEAVALGPQTFFMTMGNHECGSGTCLPGSTNSTDANFKTYLAALNRPKPWYSFDVALTASPGLARFVVVADDSWNAEQAAWLESTLAEADSKAKYTIVARHHPIASSNTGNPETVATILRHKYSLILTAHSHTYSHSTTLYGGRTVVIGLGGAPGSYAPGFATVLEQTDGKLSFVLRDVNGNPMGTPWSVGPQ